MFSVTFLLQSSLYYISIINFTIFNQTSENAEVDSWKRGLSVYTVKVDVGGLPEVKQFGIYDLVTEGDKFADQLNSEL